MILVSSRFRKVWKLRPFWLLNKWKKMAVELVSGWCGQDFLMHCKASPYHLRAPPPTTCDMPLSLKTLLFTHLSAAIKWASSVSFLVHCPEAHSCCSISGELVLGQIWHCGFTMRNPSLFGRTPLLCFFLVSFVFAATLCYADVKTVEVVGVGECAGCKESNIKTSHALSGMYAL